MPSLPELEVYREKLGPELIGRTVAAVEALDFRVVRVELDRLTAALKDNPVTSLSRYGKWLILDLGRPAQPEQLLIHLGLTGKLKLIAGSDKLPRYARFVFNLDDGRRLVMADFRLLGRIYLNNFETVKAEKLLGPDLLDITEDYFVGTLSRKRRGARDVLMDQKVIAGIGGKYADEVLWQSKLHPNDKLDRVGEARLGELYRTIMEVTRTAIALDADVDRFPENWLIPHRRTDQRCPRCGAELTARKLGGSATYYCPVDQPAPNPFRKG